GGGLISSQVPGYNMGYGNIRRKVRCHTPYYIPELVLYISTSWNKKGFCNIRRKVRCRNPLLFHDVRG
ncbi:MAG: hypothetical protein IJT72_08215, partial [Lachnospiraceae bacterium]|nr:hypothetical protein [Lachnospiraceae bacterium]